MLEFEVSAIPVSEQLVPDSSRTLRSFGDGRVRTHTLLSTISYLTPKYNLYSISIELNSSC